MRTARGPQLITGAVFYVLREAMIYGTMSRLMLRRLTRAGAWRLSGTPAARSGGARPRGEYWLRPSAR